MKPAQCDQTAVGGEQELKNLVRYCRLPNGDSKHILWAGELGCMDIMGCSLKLNKAHMNTEVTKFRLMEKKFRGRALEFGQGESLC